MVCPTHPHPAHHCMEAQAGTVNVAEYVAVSLPFFIVFDDALLCLSKAKRGEGQQIGDINEHYSEPYMHQLWDYSEKHSTLKP